MAIKTKKHRYGAARAAIVIMIVVVQLVAVSAASAAYEQVKTFPDPGATEGIKQLFKASSIAVNVTGAGGVAPGTLYVANTCGETGICGTGSIATYDSEGEFVATLPIHDTADSVAVDPATGNLFVAKDAVPGRNAIREYSPDGSEELASFGEVANFGETVEMSPEKVHGVFEGSALAVNTAGDVYFADSRAGNGRIMTFEPVSTGQFVYAGKDHDWGEGKGATSIGIDASGDLFTLSEHSIFEFAPNTTDQLCELEAPLGSVGSGAVDPANGHVFYRWKEGKSAKYIREMACGPTGEFEQVGLSQPAPQISENTRVPIAVNPSLRWTSPVPGGERPEGVLYAIDRASESASSDALGYIFAAAERLAPSVLSESVSHVSSTSATLSARINPRGHPTNYTFEYLTTAQYESNPSSERFAGAVISPLGGGTLAGVSLPLAASTVAVALSPDTAYRYRVVVASHCGSDPTEVCESIGEAEEFHTYPAPEAASLDSRAYERVSPAAKSGGEVSPLYPEHGSCRECKPQGGVGGFPVLSSAAGETIVYRGQPFSAVEGPTTVNQYIAHRTEDGWQGSTVSPNFEDKFGFLAFDTGLTKGVFAQESALGPTEAPTGYANLYVEGTGSPLGQPTPLITSSPNPEFQPLFAGASGDLSRIFFSGNDALTGPTAFAPAAEPPQVVEESDGVTEVASNLYEWTESGIALVNVLPGNTSTVPGGAAFGFGPRTVSADGSRAFWNDGENGKVYVRLGGVETVEIPGSGTCHVSIATPAEGARGACFVTASSDGSKVLLGEGELFALAADGQTYEQIAQLGSGSGFIGIAGQSDNLSTVYFVDTAVLAGADENSVSEGAQAGEPNLYRWTSSSLSFIGTLSPKTTSSGSENITVKTWDIRPSHRAAEASPDGRWLAFLTFSLDGEKTAGPCGNDGEQVGECLEAYLYDSVTGALRCVSCSPANEGPLGNSQLPLVGTAANALSQPYYLTNEGRLYFDTQNSLSISDTNDGVEDVYEFEPQGVGGCRRDVGCLSLISSGSSSSDSNFAATDRTGANVFFTTRSRLVPTDKDDLFDLYDAREGGGFAHESELPAGECRGESCQPTPGVVAEPAPGSVGMTASQVAKPGTCKKGFVKKKGHCVKKQQQQKKKKKQKHKKANRNQGQKARSKTTPSSAGGSK